MKRVLITGASSGLGKVLAQHYASKEEYNVVTLARHKADIKMDISAVESVYEVLQHFTDEAFDLVIHCAAILKLDEDLFATEELNTNLRGTYYLMSALLPKMRHGGLWVNVSSVAAHAAEWEIPLYSATKAGMHKLTQGFARRYLPDGIRVNTVTPRMFSGTNLVPGVIPKWLLDEIPVKRLLEPEELIPVIEMLESSTYIIGTEIVMDGGYLLHKLPNTDI